MKRKSLRQTKASTEFLTTREAAALTKMSMAWFERKRWDGTGPPYLRRGRTVRYLRTELLAWWERARCASLD